MSGGGGGHSYAADQSNALLQKQIDLQEQQYKQQLTALSEQQFNIIKSQGGMNWNSSTPAGIQGRGSKNGGSSGGGHRFPFF